MANIKDIRPLADRVVVEIVERDEMSAGGIFIPKSARDETVVWQAKVLAVGPGKRLKNGKVVEPDVKAGDKVLLGKYLGKEMTLADGKIVVVRQDDIDAVFES